MTPDEVWPDVVEAFAHYGKKVTPRLRGERLKLINRLMEDGYEAEDLVAAVHGYVHFHGGLEKKPDGFEPQKYFTPESVFRLEKIEPRIELGLEGSWERPMTAQERQAKARERVEAARAVQRKGGLRAVEGGW